MGQIKSAKEMAEQLSKAQNWSSNSETDNDGMTYEEGVEAALRWALGEADEEPIEKDYPEEDFEDEEEDEDE